eukprot:6171975-Pleurochrysis_carterae.AAC.1
MFATRIEKRPRCWRGFSKQIELDILKYATNKLSTFVRPLQLGNTGALAALLCDGGDGVGRVG